jgi:hypothetical protein
MGSRSQPGVRQLDTSDIGDQAPAVWPERRGMNLETVIFGFFVLLTPEPSPWLEPTGWHEYVPPSLSLQEARERI